MASPERLDELVARARALFESKHGDSKGCFAAFSPAKIVSALPCWTVDPRRDRCRPPRLLSTNARAVNQFSLPFIIRKEQRPHRSEYHPIDARVILLHTWVICIKYKRCSV